MKESHILLGIVFLLGFAVRPYILRCPVETRTVYETEKQYVPIYKYKTRTVYIGESNKERNQVYVPPEGGIEISPKDKTKKLSDIVEVKRTWYGLCLRPGVGYGANPSRLLLDFKVAYANRLGLVTGVSVGSGISPTLGLAYHLDGVSKDWLMNTEVTLGYAPLYYMPWYLGLRINL